MKNKLIALLAAACFLTSCTENQMAKHLGGTMTVELPLNTEFINASWKGDELWYTYRMRRTGEQPDIITMQEDSNYGLMQGKVQFNEH